MCKGKFILITGVNGFIGSHMAQVCIQNGYKVVGIDIVSTTENAGVQYFQMNLYKDSIEDVLLQYEPFAIIHCAGMADVNYSVKHPDSDFTSNVMVTRNVLYALKDYSPKTKFIFLSSAGVYGNPYKIPIRESDEKNPISPYALHKTLVEEICWYFIKQFHIDIKILRVFSAYGNGLRKQIFWDMGQKIKKYQKLVLFGTGKETRDFIHINDLTKAILMITETEDDKEVVYNVANGEEISIRQVAEIFCRECGLPLSCISFNQTERVGNPINWCANIGKIKTLGYSAQVPIEQGIREYVEWLKQVGVL